MSNKIIRTIGLFSRKPSNFEVEKLKRLREKAQSGGFEVQTLRLTAPGFGFGELEELVSDEEIILGLGTIDYMQALDGLEAFYETNREFFNVASTDPALLFEVMKHKSEKTFNFTYVFHNPPSSPYFPSSDYGQDGFAVGLQATDLSEECVTLEEYFDRLEAVYAELIGLFGEEEGFLGIDSSLAPMFEGKSSFVELVRRFMGEFDTVVTTDFFVRITNFLKQKNPKPVGLCGLMLPALEDFALAQEYEKGHFSIERNIFLSLHSGLGIDTYPIGIDEKPGRVREVLSLMAALAEKHAKPLSARFVSDGKAKVGDRTDFGNRYLKDVIIRKL